MTEAATEAATEWRGTKDRWREEELKGIGEGSELEGIEAAEGNGGKGARGESAAAVAAARERLWEETSVAATRWRGSKSIVTARGTTIEEESEVESIAISAGSERTA